MNKERDILKTLLLKEELELLNQLKEKLLSEDQFTAEVAKVLASAVKRSQQQNNNLQLALAEPIKAGVESNFTENKESIIDSLLPIMGQLIRKTVANSIKRFVTDINRTLELAFSKKALKWRWQAFKTGESFAEIVFQKTIRYQVKELFLVNRENGLLIEHAGTDDMLKDNNAISAMLTVIQDFIGDSLQSPDSNLLSAEIDDSLILISTGPNAFLASVVKGSPTERLKEKSQQLIENIHAEFSTSLTQEETYRNNLDLEDYLRSHLITKSISDSIKETNWTPWIVGMVLLISGLIYWPYYRGQQIKGVIDKVETIDGFYLKSIEKTSNGFQVNGLLDPLADLSKVENEELYFNTKPYVSLDSGIINKRILNALSNLKGVNAKFSNGEVLLSGIISEENRILLFDKLNKVIGIKSINNQLSIDQNSEVKMFLQENQIFIPKISNKFINDQIVLIGETTYNGYHLFKSKFNAKFTKLAKLGIDETNLIITDSTDKLLKEINQKTIRISSKKEDKNTSQISNTINSLKIILGRSINLHITLIGNSDCNGKRSDIYSKQRAEKLKNIFLNNGIKSDIISTKINSCSSFQTVADESKQNVFIEVKQQ